MVERIEAFTDRRVARYWTLVGIVNGWAQSQTPAPETVIEAWELVRPGATRSRLTPDA